MNCNCVKETEAAITDMMTSKLGAPVEVKSADIAFLFGGASGMSMALNTRFTVTADAKGYKRGKQISMIASFCPFCGTSTKPAEENQNA
ncbi:hypothetical protein [Pandoraea sp. SD6-2]|uniref:hypothetical protein n=1 Tax=Pandoraea sp. SD6-2 TaxID=1286093 RepID=UPI00032E4F3F|nr:hypothetical protein [Pandoraea sp. SD6-2]EON11948.1 gp41 [Pandoraea sp. SD6-2]